MEWIENVYTFITMPLLFCDNKNRNWTMALLNTNVVKLWDADRQNLRE